DQILDGVAADADFPGLDVDDGGGPPAAGFVDPVVRRRCLAASHVYTTWLARMALMSSREYPRSRRIWSVWAPSAGGGVLTSGSPPAILKPARTTSTGRSTPGTPSKRVVSARAWIWGRASASGTVRTGPAGTPMPERISAHSCADRAASACSSSA